MEEIYYIKQKKYYAISFYRLEDIIKNEYDVSFNIIKGQHIEMNEIDPNSHNVINIVINGTGELSEHEKMRIIMFKRDKIYNWMLKDLINDMVYRKLIPKGKYLLLME